MNRSLFDFKPASWIPTQDKAVLEYCRNIKREEMETTNANGYSIRVVPHPSSAVACELFNWIYGINSLSELPATEIMLPPKEETPVIESDEELVDEDAGVIDIDTVDDE